MIIGHFAHDREDGGAYIGELGGDSHGWKLGRATGFAKKVLAPFR